MTKQFCMAVILLISSILIFPQDQESPIQYFNRGETAYSRGDYFGAVEAYKSAIFLNSEYGEAYEKLGMIFFVLQEYDEALAYLQDAARLQPDKNTVKTLLGRVYVGLGKLEEAEALYLKLQKQEPYNIEVSMGLGEIFTAKGDLTKAAEQFSYTLSLSPKNRRALLSLALIFRYQNRNMASQHLIELALQHHGDNPLVQLNAGRHYYRIGQLDKAIGYIERAAQMQPGSPDPLLVLGGIYLEKKDYLRVVDIMNTVIQLDPENHIAWYTRGVAHYALGDIEKGVQGLTRSLIIRPDDEITRYSLEEISLRHFEEKDNLRLQLAEYHINEAKRRLEAYYNKEAMESLLKSLRLNPHDRGAREEMAKLLLNEGYIASYYEELRIITQLAEDGAPAIEELLKLKNIDQKLLLARQWNTDQFSETFDPILISISSGHAASGMDHPGADDFLLQQLGRQIQSGTMFDVVNRESGLSTNNIFEISRYDGSEYFFHFNFIEGEGSFTIEATVFLSRTGTNLGSLRVSKSGNNSISKAIDDMASRLEGLFYYRGRLLKREYGKGIINLGRKHGINVEDELIIIKRGHLRLDNTKIGYLYSTDVMLGKAKVTRIDDYISEVDVNFSGFYDEVNPGDHVIVFDEEKEITAIDNDNLIIYKDILTIY